MANRSVSIKEKYQYIGQIGEGGFATVQKYYNVVSREKVAVKQLKRMFYSNLDYKKRFRREVEILQDLARAPNIIPIIDYELRRDYYAYVMPLATTNLSDYVQKKNNMLEEKTRLQIFEKVVGAIKFAHNKKILHRDITPNNVLLFNRSGKMDVFVSDFGLGKSIDSYSNLTNSSVANYGQIFYVSPEQREKLKSATFQSDIYSLGKLLNFLLTGKSPEFVHPCNFTPLIKKATSPSIEDRHLSIHDFDTEYQAIKKFLYSADALHIAAEISSIGNNKEIDWIQIHKSMMLDYSGKNLFKSYVKPIITFFIEENHFAEYYGELGSNFTFEFVEKFAQSLHSLPQVGWPYAAIENFGKFFRLIFSVVREPKIKLICLNELWYFSYVLNQWAVQKQIFDLLASCEIPIEIQSGFADHIVKSDVSRQKPKVPISDLIKLNLPPLVRNALVNYSNG